MIIIKIRFGETIRRLAVESAITFNTLKRFCIDMFDELKDDRSFDITYIDDENDVISIGSDVELSEAFRLLAANNESTLTLTIQSKGSTKPQKKVLNLLKVNKDDIEIKKEEVQKSQNENIDANEIELRKLEEIVENLNKAVEQANIFTKEEESESDIKSTVKEIIESIGQKLKQLASVIDEKIFDPISKAAKSTLEEFQNEIQKLKEDILKLKQQIKQSLEDKPSCKSAEKSVNNSETEKCVNEKSKEEKLAEEKEKIAEQEEVNCSVVMCDLERLEEMGFMDRKLNLELLAKHPNNLDAVVLELLNRRE